MDPIFRKAFVQTEESGQYDRLALLWQGADIKSQGAVDVLILTPGQVFLIFSILLFFLFTAFICLALEFFMYYAGKLFRSNKKEAKLYA